MEGDLFFLILVPFFVSFVIRTVQWNFILGDDGLHLRPAEAARDLARTTSTSCATPIAVVAGITYNFLPFDALPLYVSLERIDRRLVEAAKDLYATRSQAFRKVVLPLSLPGDLRRGDPDVRPRDGRLRERDDARRTRHDDDRPDHPELVPRAAQLPGGGGAVCHRDAADADRSRSLYARLLGTEDVAA